MPGESHREKGGYDTAKDAAKLSCGSASKLSPSSDQITVILLK